MKFSKEKIRTIIKEEMSNISEMQGSTDAEKEAAMVNKNINTIAASASELKAELEGRDDIPEWVQEKVAVTAAMINSVLLSMRDKEEVR